MQNRAKQVHCRAHFGVGLKNPRIVFYSTANDWIRFEFVNDLKCANDPSLACTTKLLNLSICMLRLSHMHPQASPSTCPPKLPGCSLCIPRRGEQGVLEGLGL